MIASPEVDSPAVGRDGRVDVFGQSDDAEMTPQLSGETKTLVR